MHVCVFVKLLLLFLCALLALRYALRNKNEDETCEELVALLTDVLNRELSETDLRMFSQKAGWRSYDMHWNPR